MRKHLIAMACLSFCLASPGWALGQERFEELTKVPPNAALFVHIRAADLWKSPMLKLYREVLPKAGAEGLAFLEERIAPPLSSIDRVTLVILMTPGKREETAVLIHTTTPLNEKALVGDLQPTIDGRLTYYDLPKSGGAMQILGERTLLLGSAGAPRALRQRAEGANEGPTAITAGLDMARTGKFMIVAAGNTSLIPRNELEKLPPMFQPLARAKSVLATVDFGDTMTFNVKADYADADEAKEAQQVVESLRTMGKAFLGQAKREMDKKLDGVKGVTPLYDADRVIEIIGPIFALAMIKRGEELLTGIPVTREKDSLAIKIVVPEELKDYGAGMPMMVALLVPAVQKVREAAARTQEMNNLKQMGLAFHIYHDQYKFFPPPAICDKNGKPLLSWRVAILPYIEQNQLYQQFKLDEPWDSEHNIKLLPQMPIIYRLVSDAPADGKTYYRVFVGADKNGSALFKSYDDKVGIRKITDGTSNTLMIVQAADAVPWTKPEELTFDAKGPLPRLNTSRRGSSAAFCDGSVRFLSESIAEATLRALITRDGGEAIGPD